MTTTTIDDIAITSGPSENPTPTGGMTVMEAVAHFASETPGPFQGPGRTPKSSCVVANDYLKVVNNAIADDSLRTELLRPLVRPLMGSAASADTLKRRAVYLARETAIRVAPVLLGLYGFDEQADTFRSMTHDDTDITWRVIVEATQYEVREDCRPVGFSFDVGLNRIESAIKNAEGLREMRWQFRDRFISIGINSALAIRNAIDCGADPAEMWAIAPQLVTDMLAIQ